jgi:hypothetical protein
MIEIILSNIPGIVGSILLACFGAYLVWRNGHKSRLAAAAATFRAAIDPDAFTNWSGHDLHKALAQAFPAHKAAAHEFKRYLGPIDKLRLDRAWGEYHGGNEECPDFFKLYCIPASGPKLLKQRLGALRNAGNHT